ncbi:hypothetical protein N657DRAFT_649458 [Parathielavia appendiculata]|uniref:F-box domain-containing protein n=1 Tax=Parathielavia appendiculata TaxID=2587402 RepID=A0AAN6YZQ6_9PEZI|nr:hypothetical protein N657DRAFT_649458 [Parathielavia appendiculata]
MLLITQLPCEIIAEILRNLDHLRFLSPALLTCRHFYTSFKEYHGIEISILRHQVTPALLPHAVAVVEASRLPRRRVFTSSFRCLLDELYERPARLVDRLPTFPTTLIWKISRTHDVIHAFATDFATRALDCIAPGAASAGPCTVVALSPLEYFRFRRAFYRVELFYTLFQDSLFRKNMDNWFFSRHPFWENEQIGCVHEYLLARFAEASRDIVAHDVFFGEISIDYLTPGEDDRYHTWLSQGVEFVYNLTVADSYDAKHSMLQSALDSRPRCVNLLEALVAFLDGLYLPDGNNMEQLSEEELRSFTPGHAYDPAQDDIDRGPYESWRHTRADLRLETSLMHADDGWLRERAYVFWDQDRVQTYFRAGFGEGPSPDAIREREYHDMLDTFAQRSKIWRKGGRGYWSTDDTSRIVWPDKLN